VFSYIKTLGVLICLCSATVSAKDISGADNLQLKSLMDAHWAYTLEENPTLATAAGVNDYNHWRFMNSNALATKEK